MHRLIAHNAAEIRRLHAAARDLTKRDEERRLARTEFAARYDALAFPGGLEEGMCRLRESDRTAVESALAFVEARPYFFRSQYIATKLLRMLKQLNLSTRQTERLHGVLAAITRRKLARQSIR